MRAAPQAATYGSGANDVVLLLLWDGSWYVRASAHCWRHSLGWTLIQDLNVSISVWPGEESCRRTRSKNLVRFKRHEVCSDKFIFLPPEDTGM